jgi:hypothetical protein
MQFRTGPSAYATFYIGEIGETIPIPRTAAIGMLVWTPICPLSKGGGAIRSG